MQHEEQREAIEFLRKTHIGKLALAYSVTQVLESYAMFDPIGAFDYLTQCVKDNKEPAGFYAFLPYRSLSWREIIFSISVDAISFYRAIDESLSFVKKGLTVCLNNQGISIDIDSLDLMKVAELGAVSNPRLSRPKPILTLVRN